MLDHKYNIAYWADILSEHEFIQVSKQYCSHNGSGADTLNWLYKLGRDVQKLEMAYDEFVSYVKGNRHYGAQHTPRYWRRRDCGFYREGTKYRKSVEHKPKEASQKQVWREASGLNKDRRKRKSWSSNRRRVARDAANGSFRQWCKQNINHGRYEAFSTDDSDWRLFHNSRDWW